MTATPSHVQPPSGPTGPAWVRHAADVMKRAGHRSSNPRMAVVQALGRQDCVLTARDISDRLRDEGNDVGIATVYRTLELLHELGLVQRLDLGEGSAAGYEPADPSGVHHHHLVCDSCGRVSAFDDEPLERAIERLAKRLEYDVGGHDVILRGSCPACATGSA